MAIKELWLQEAVRQKRLTIKVADALLNWSDIGARPVQQSG